METDSWSRFLASSKRRQSALQSRYDARFGSDEMEGGEDESRAEFACPFCGEDFDIVGLCFHIDDEHPVEANNGVCPVCAARVGTDMVAHTTTEHASIFKIQRRRRLRKVSSGSHSTHSLLRKDLHEDNLQSLLGGSFVTSNSAPDPLLSSFIFNFHAVDTSDGQPETLAEETFAGKVSDEKLVESAVPAPSYSDKNLEESILRSEFVRQLVLSTIFDDDA
ncbi:protein DEHYDRATION-INDUCED 19 homolog 2-like [Zingiber officinale]|uniref:protein DEHYDRATION-INDUCED 19 homolog 2-like n=1 Tax=Zingiber officinale TaxID=94328 RepID=UPI001C4B9A19|nr:protein DEHYDRATION-INDUCED 19 homolog 2-like [Zingiber officinale]